MSQMIEINGIKMAIDERTATIQKIDTFKVGDPVKLLKKSYSGFTNHYGVLIGFDAFKARPTITVAYLDSAELKYASVYQGSEDELLAVESHDLVMEKTWILDRMKDRVIRKEQELAEERSKMDNFIAMFGKYFEQGLPTPASV